MEDTNQQVKVSEYEQKKDAIQKWTHKKLLLSEQWIDQKRPGKLPAIQRKGVYTCEIGENLGTEQSEFRPVLVISNEQINKYSGAVVILPLTTTLKIRKGKGGKMVPKFRHHYFLSRHQFSFLNSDSAVLCEQVRTVSKVRIGNYLGQLDEGTFRRIIEKVMVVLGHPHD